MTMSYMTLNLDWRKELEGRGYLAIMYAYYGIIREKK